MEAAVWIVVGLLGLGGCASAPPKVPPPDPSLVMAGMWPFLYEQGEHGAPCRIDLREKEGNRARVTLDPHGRIAAIVEVDANGNRFDQIDLEYDAQSRIAAIGSEKKGEWMRYAYDAEGRLSERRFTRMKGAECQWDQRFAYEGERAVIQDDKGCDGTVDDTSLKIVRDERGLWQMDNEGGSGAVVVYDDAGRTLGVASGNNPVLVYDRDETGRIVHITPFASTWISAAGGKLHYDCPDEG